MLDHVAEREITSKCGEKQRVCRDRAACHVPDALRERELCSKMICCDKVFAAAWLDGLRVVLGTKDNRLLLVDTQKDRSVEITLPLRDSSVENTNRVASCGIHSISLNFSKSLLVTGGNNPNDAAVFRLPSFRPARLLKKHVDWIFSTCWLTDTVLATGSRDSTVKLWSVNQSKAFLNDHPIADRKYHSDRVRDLKYCDLSESLVSLSRDGSCKIWDPHIMEVVSTAKLSKDSLQCLAMQYPVLAVGSRHYISFIDMRCGHITKHVDSLDEGWGVRSLSFRGSLLTCGGGKGRLSFYELRAMKYLDLLPKDNGKRLWYYNTGKGVQNINGASVTEPEQQYNWHAVYAHSYDVTGTCLLTVGGPVLYGHKGFYAAVW